MLQSLKPYDYYSWDKYFGVVQQLNQYNWVDCHEYEGLSDLL